MFTQSLTPGPELENNLIQKRTLGAQALPMNGASSMESGAEGMPAIRHEADAAGFAPHRWMWSHVNLAMRFSVADRHLEPVYGECSITVS
jgi:hypothetical protein